MATLFALCDCNAFYPSCERVFDPKLAGRPVVVLSNNDGCVIARTDEAKAIGIAMGAPLFQVEDLLSRHDVAVFSSNYELYGDVSRRVMEVLGQFTPDVEIYSIDEAFLDLAGLRRASLAEVGREIQCAVLKQVGVPVSIGIAETKTLAKVANKIAKQSGKAAGVLDLTDPRDVECALRRLPVEEVWGVGRRYQRLLKAQGVATARQLRDLPDRWVRQHLTVVGLRTVHELRGISCLPLELAPPAKRSLTHSRSFGATVETFDEVQRAVASFVTRAAERLRTHELAAGVITVFCHTNRFDGGEPYFGSATIELAVPTDSTTELLRYAGRCLKKAFRAGLLYKKAGVMFGGLVPAGAPSRSFFAPERRERLRELMRAVDQLNRKFGRDTVHFGAPPSGERWQMRQAHRSPRYTTRWAEVLKIK